MSSYEGWTAGKHWNEGMALGGQAANAGDDAVTDAWLTSRAAFHLAAARLLLNHPPGQDLTSKGGSNHDWRTRA